MTLETCEHPKGLHINFTLLGIMAHYMSLVKGAVHRYRSHAITHYFTASEIIHKHYFTRIYKIYNKPMVERLHETMYKKCRHLKSLINRFICISMKPLLNRGDYI